MYCLDTNIIIAFFRGVKPIIEKIREISATHSLAITTITLCELYKGAYLSERKEKSINEILALLSSVELIEFTEDACHWFGEEYFRLHKEGKVPQEADLMIASIAKAHNATIITREKRAFKHIKLSIERW
jgi:predicted nucleic acid-binding protein